MGRSGQVLRLAAACVRLLSPLLFLFLHGSGGAITTRVCNCQVHLER